MTTTHLDTASKSIWQGDVSSFRPNLLLFFLSSKEFYRAPLFSRNEVFCSPDTNPLSLLGKVTAIRTTPGSYDVRDVLKTLPEAQKPELIVVKADASLRNCPRNLAKFQGPKVLIVGDTHHMRQPLQSVIRYAREEPFDVVIFDHTRHHASLFMEAGIRNVQWLPAVDYAYLPRPISETPSHGVTFVGQIGRHHPYRREVIEFLRAQGLPVETLRGALQQTADFYADSAVTLNVSLNGDLNLRVFEALAAGGFLLTDELPESAGLGTLFESGKHLVTWRSKEQLLELAKHYLAHPAEALAIRRAAAAEMAANHSPAVKIREFFDLVFNGKVNPRYSLEREAARAASVRVEGNLTGLFRHRIEPYEAIQEIHRTSGEVTVYCQNPDALKDLCNLPLLRVAGTDELKIDASAPLTSHILWWEGAADELGGRLLQFPGLVVIAPRATDQVRQTLQHFGYAPRSQHSAVHDLKTPSAALSEAAQRGEIAYIQRLFGHAVAVASTSVECLALGALIEQLGDTQAYRYCVQRAAELDRNNSTALINLAALSLDDGVPNATLMLLEELSRLDALPEEARELKQNLLAEHGQGPEMQNYYRLAGMAPVQPAEKRRRILMVTNLLPPQELGGYGRKMWEFANGLRLRGHEVRILTANMPAFGKTPTADEQSLETVVDRSLKLFGSWNKNGAQPLTDPAEIARRIEHNRRVFDAAIKTIKPEIVFAGNMDFLGVSLIDAALGADLPVLQALGNMAPGYAQSEQPMSPLYWIGSCSHWNASVVQAAGYMPGRVDVIYPGARVDRFFRFFLPDTSKLRICYAGLVMPFKGVHTLVDALALLHSAGIDFTAEIAGETTDPAFVKQLRATAEASGFAEKLSFTGFLDRSGLSALFARSNVLVFPSIVEEGFGISQVEAMASGLVVVSSGTGGAREIVRDGIDGLLFPAGNAGVLADKLAALAREKEAFVALQKAGQQRAQDFSVDRSIAKIEELMGELIG